MAKDPYRYFRVEASDILERMSRGFSVLQDSRPAPEAVPELLRLAHTLKGAAHVVRQPEIAELAHNIETLLSPHQGEKTVPTDIVSEAITRTDQIAERLAYLSEPAKAAQAQVQGTTDGAPGAEVDASLRTIRVELPELDSLLDGIGAAFAHLTALKQRTGGIEDAVSAANALGRQIRTGDNGARSEWRAEAGQLDELRNLLLQLERTITQETERVERELKRVGGIADQLRLVPAKGLFLPLHRVTRMTANALGKKVHFETSGGEQRVDAQVLSALREALLHVVRNAVAHGIESAGDRVRAGKPAAGKVRLRIEGRGNRVSFVCSDDGCGINADALRQAAVERQMMTAEEAERMSMEDMTDLILRPGVSTSPAVSEVSGRGIGLDVVRETVVRLKGDVHIQSEPGKGTTIDICVPVSLLSTVAIRMQTGKFIVSIPLDSVEKTMRLDSRDTMRGGGTIAVSGETIPLLPLQRIFPPSNNIGGVAGPGVAAVVRWGKKRAAVAADHLLGITTVVLRPLPPFVGALPMIAGGALDVDGRPTVVLDAAGLIEAAENQPSQTAGTVVAPLLPVLVIDDSLTTRMLEQSILESAGYEVQVASSGEEALQKARAIRFGLFLVDVEMPGMDGYEFIKTAQRDPQLRDIPSILVTSRSSAQDRERGRKIGAADFVVKSEFDQAYLLNRIQRLVRRA